MSRVQASAAEILIGKRGDIMGASVAVHTENGREYCKFKPAQQKLLKVLILHIICHKSADVRGPPGNSRKSHIQSCAELISHGFKGAWNVARPVKGCILLASCPAAADELQALFFPSLFLNSIIKGLGIKLGI